MSLFSVITSILGQVGQTVGLNFAKNERTGTKSTAKNLLDGVEVTGSIPLDGDDGKFPPMPPVKKRDSITGVFHD